MAFGESPSAVGNIMPLPLLAAATGLVGGKIAGGLADIFGGDAAADDLRRAQANARGDIQGGYAGAIGTQNPIYQTGLNAYENLAKQQQGGAFKDQQVNPFHYDPNAVQNDPMYKAQLASGTRAIDNSAERSGDLFSGKTANDQLAFGQNLFANRYDALEGQGQTAQNSAVAENQAANAGNFGQGIQLSQPGFQAANQIANLNTEQGTALAQNDLGMGQINAGNALRTSGAIGGILGDVGSGVGDILAPGAPMPGQIGPGYGMPGSAATGATNINDPNYFYRPQAPALGMGY